MPGPKGIVRWSVLALGLVLALVTAWVCVVSGLVWMLAGTLGAGPALLCVGGTLIGLFALFLGLAALSGAKGQQGRSIAGPTGLLRGVLTVAGMPGGLRLLLASSSVLFALLAMVALLLATRKTGRTSESGRMRPR